MIAQVMQTGEHPRRRRRRRRRRERMWEEIKYEIISWKNEECKLEKTT